jgi:3-deoxy-D-manno-octulosonic-acid transferase
VLLEPRLILWNLFLLGASPLLVAMKLRRYLKKGSTHEFDLQRWAIPVSFVRTNTNRIVFLCASYGEVLLIEPVSKALVQARPDVRIIWAIRDPQTLRQYRGKNPNIDVVPWPFDFNVPVLKWLNLIDPHVLVFTERFSFPNLVVGSRVWGAHLALVNGRTRSAERAGSLVASYTRWLFAQFDALLFNSKAAADRARGYASSKVILDTTGNIKLDLLNKDVNEDVLTSLRTWLDTGDEPLLVAGSTGNAEEDLFVLDAFESVRRRLPCRLLIAPRKVLRAGETAGLALERGYTVSRRSAPVSNVDVFVLDTIGELATAYGLGIAAYVGGSLNGMGHNVVEPLEKGLPVAYGPKRGHFQELQEACERAGIGFRISTSEELAEHWTTALTDEIFRKSVRERAELMLREQRGAVDRTAQTLLALIGKS